MVKTTTVIRKDFFEENNANENFLKIQSPLTNPDCKYFHKSENIKTAARNRLP